jgi:hypothetical protein
MRRLGRGMCSSSRHEGGKLRPQMRQEAMDEDLSRWPKDGCSGRAAPGRVAAAKLERRGGPLSAPARDGEGRPREAGQRRRHAEEQGRRGTEEKEKMKRIGMCVMSGR